MYYVQMKSLLTKKAREEVNQKKLLKEAHKRQEKYGEKAYSELERNESHVPQRSMSTVLRRNMYVCL
jgi:putative cell wall-binding protein